MSLKDDVKGLLGLEAGHTVEAQWYKKYTDSVNDLDDGDFAWLSDAYKKGDEPPSSGRKYPYKIHGDVKEEGWRAAWGRAHQQPPENFKGGPSKEEVIAKLKRARPKGVEVEGTATVAEGSEQVEEKQDVVETTVEEAQDTTATEYEETVRQLQAKVEELEAKLTETTNANVTLQSALEAKQAELDGLKVTVEKQNTARAEEVAVVEEQNTNNLEQELSDAKVALESTRQEAVRARLSLTRAMQLVPHMDVQRITAAVDVLGEMSEEAFALFLDLRQNTKVAEPNEVKATKEKEEVKVTVKGAVLNAETKTDPTLSWDNFKQLFDQPQAAA